MDFTITADETDETPDDITDDEIINTLDNVGIDVQSITHDSAVHIVASYDDGDKRWDYHDPILAAVNELTDELAFDVTEIDGEPLPDFMDFEG